MAAPALSAQIQGQGTVGADNFNTYEQTCDVFAELRAFVGLPGIQVFARGGEEIADGLQGAFYWNSTSTASDDGVNFIKPPATGGAGTPGCWVRIPPALQAFTVSTLPSPLFVGQRETVTDAAAPSFLAVVAGGGSTVCPVMWNGANWVAG